MRFLFTLILMTAAAGIGVAVAVPDTYLVEHAVSIHARPSSIYPYLTDVRRWDGWSPWKKLDPDMKRTRSGNATGRGAVYQWEGNQQVGRGRLEITDTRAPSSVRTNVSLTRPVIVNNITLDFVSPFEAKGASEFALVERGGATVVTWKLRGKRSLADKFKGLVGNMDALIGQELGLGLFNLKKIVES